MAGVFTKQIRKLQADFAALSLSQARETEDGDLVIPRHAPVRKGKCPKCGKAHTINEHRFHGHDSHIRTHGDESGGVMVVLTGGGSTKRGSAFKLPPFPEPEAKRRAAAKKVAPPPKNKKEKPDPWAKGRGDVTKTRGRKG